MRVLTGRAVPASTASPYRPLTEALLQALRGLAFPADDGLAPWLPALRAILPAIAGPEAEGHGDHSPAVRGEAVLQLLRRLAGPAGLLLVLEDLHWADPDTLAILEYLSDNLSAEPVLCLATCRDEPATPARRTDGPAARTARRDPHHARPALGRRGRRDGTRVPADRVPRMSSPGYRSWLTGFRSWSRSRWPHRACRARSPRRSGPGWRP